MTTFIISFLTGVALVPFGIGVFILSAVLVGCSLYGILFAGIVAWLEIKRLLKL